MTDKSVLYSGDTAHGHYEVVDVIYAGRQSRMLYSGNHQAAQSGWALDDNSPLLFDYNERFMELARGLAPKRVLLIGGGAFTLPRALQREFPPLRLDVVELDAGLLELAERYFDFTAGPHTQVHISDGLHYLATSTETYDLIVLDVFMHSEVPPAFQTPDTARSLAKHLHPGGVVAQNIIAAYHGERAATLRRQTDAYQAAFQDIQLFPAGQHSSLWLPQNLVITAQTGPHAPRPAAVLLRYQALARLV